MCTTEKAQPPGIVYLIISFLKTNASWSTTWTPTTPRPSSTTWRRPGPGPRPPGTPRRAAPPPPSKTATTTPPRWLRGRSGGRRPEARGRTTTPVGARFAAWSDSTATAYIGNEVSEILAGADKSRPDSSPSSSSSSSSCGGVERPRRQEVDYKAPGAANAKKTGGSLGGDSDRSGSSSPDVGDGKVVPHKPTKLKSRLQQRYFEANNQSEKARLQRPVVETVVQNYNPEPKDEYRPSNLDILASAVNLHTKREEENRLNALRDQNEKRLAREAAYASTSSELMPSGSRGVQEEENVPQGASSHSPLPLHQGRLDGLHKRLSPDKVQGMPHTLTSSHRDGLSMRRDRSLDHAERFHKVNSLSNTSPAETVVIRREISKEMKLPSPAPLHHTSNDSRGNEQQRFPEVPQFSFYPNAMPNNHVADIPKSFPHSFFDQGSRIARIIAEELQKDEDCPHKPVILRNAPMVQRVNPDEVRSYTTIIHGPQDLNTKSDYPQYFSGNDRVNHSAASSQAVSAAHSSHPLIVRNDRSHENHSLNYYSENSSYVMKNGNSEDNQPQDLSLKPKERTARGSMDKRHLTTLLLGPTSPSPGHLNRGYFSSPNSPLIAGATLTATESGLQRKSASPTVVPDSRQHFASHPHRTSGKWERTEPVHSKELNRPLAVDPKILRDMMMADTLHRWSEARQSEVNKKRGAHLQ
ncbi:hypothetical protein Btru_069764 [Bulinus truncatus]|nr:hypothetical protein Btru_069764 [Bulinus truncatus]